MLENGMERGGRYRRVERYVPRNSSEFATDRYVRNFASGYRKSAPKRSISTTDLAESETMETEPVEDVGSGMTTSLPDGTVEWEKGFSSALSTSTNAVHPAATYTQKFETPDFDTISNRYGTPANTDAFRILPS